MLFKNIYLKIILVLCLGIMLEAKFASRSRSHQQELLFGGYVSTLRNLSTQGATLAYRFWLTRQPSETGESNFTIFYPRPFTLGFEIRGGYLTSPESGWEGSALLDLKYEHLFTKDISAYLLLCCGGSYSEIDYVNSTNYNFINRAGIGLCLQRLLIQGVYEHRSNVSTSIHNRGLDVLQVSLGFRY